MAMGNGDGTFIPPASCYQGTAGGHFVGAADFNSDGALDVFAVGRGTPAEVASLLQEN